MELKRIDEQKDVYYKALPPVGSGLCISNESALVYPHLAGVIEQMHAVGGNIQLHFVACRVTRLSFNGRHQLSSPTSRTICV